MQVDLEPLTFILNQLRKGEQYHQINLDLYLPEKVE